MPAPDHGLTITALVGHAGSFTLGPIYLCVPAGRVLVVLGPSGAGKTMLLETIAGLRPCSSGAIALAGTSLTALPPEQRRIGLVFQDAALFPHLSVRDNIAFGPRAIRHHAGPGPDALMHRLAISHLASRAPRSLSGGERQRAAIARALAIRPRLLLLDEPLSALDLPAREDMRTLLQDLLADLDIPAIHVTHDRDKALSIGDDLAIIAAGQLRQTGPAAQVAAEPADPDCARLLGWAELGPGTAASRTIQAGQILLPDIAPRDIHPAVTIFYRPEDILLGPQPPGTPQAATLTAPVRHIIRTRPLARITLASDPPVTALTLHRDLERHAIQPGEPVQATLPPDSLRIFPATQD